MLPRAKGADTSGLAESLTTPVPFSRILPMGATIRLHQFPKPSRYAVTRVGGSVVRRSGRTVSKARE